MAGWYRIAVATIVLSSAAVADSYEAGLRLLNEGNLQEAVRKFEKSSRPEAAYQMGYLAETGKITNCDLECAQSWYMKAADGGILLAIFQIGGLYLRVGQTETAANVYRHGARWGEVNSRGYLIQHGMDVPEPDLWNDYQARLASAQAAELQRQQNASAALGAALVAGVTLWSSQQQGKAAAAQSWQAQPAYRPPVLCPDGSYVGGTTCVLAPNGTYVGQ